MELPVSAATFHLFAKRDADWMSAISFMRTASHALSICNGQLSACPKESSPTLSGLPPLGASSNRLALPSR